MKKPSLHSISYSKFSEEKAFSIFKSSLNILLNYKENLSDDSIIDLKHKIITAYSSLLKNKAFKTANKSRKILASHLELFELFLLIKVNLSYFSHRLTGKGERILKL